MIGCAKVSDAGQSEGVKTYLALGDSYTIGQSVEEEERWPNLLVNKLNQNGLNFGKPKIIAKTGWRTDNLTEAIDKELRREKFDFVSLLIGVNNLFQGKSIDVFKIEFKELLSIAIQKSKTGKDGVFVLSIPDYGQTPYGESNAKVIGIFIDLWNDTCLKICEEEGVSFYNITEISRLGLVQSDLVADDGLHPSGKQYGLWVDEVYQSVVGKIK